MTLKAATAIVKLYGYRLRATRWGYALTDSDTYADSYWPTLAEAVWHARMSGN